MSLSNKVHWRTWCSAAGLAGIMSLCGALALTGCSATPPQFYGANAAAYLKEKPVPDKVGWVYIYSLSQPEVVTYSSGVDSMLSEIFKASAPSWDIGNTEFSHMDDKTALATGVNMCIPDVNKNIPSIYWLLINNRIEPSTAGYQMHYQLLDRKCQLITEKSVPFESFDNNWDDDGFTEGRLAGAELGSEVVSFIYQNQNSQLGTAHNEALAAAKEKADGEALQQAEQQRLLAEQEQQAMSARIESQPCPSTESGWFFLKGRCNKQHQPHGQGEAESQDRAWRYVGQFKAGRMVNGTFTKNNQPVFVGGMQNGRFDGQGRCAMNGGFEACEFKQGQRVDALFLQHVAQQQAEALAAKQREAEARARQQQQEAEAQAAQERQALATKRAECQRDAEDRSGINTICTCDAQGEIYCNNHNRGLATLLGAMDSISAQAQASADASTEALNNMAVAALAENASDDVHSDVAPTSVAMISAAERDAITSQVSSNLAMPQPPVVAPVPAQVKHPVQPKKQPPVVENTASARQSDAEPVGNNDILPEAVAICRKNGAGYWFCNGPLQETSVGEVDEAGLAKVRALSGCSAPRHEAGKTDDGWTIYLCGYGLDSYDRDLVKIKKLVLPRLSYHCGQARDRDSQDHKCHQAYTTIEHY